jgi:PAS domain S-box-containing protein
MTIQEKVVRRDQPELPKEMDLKDKIAELVDNVQEHLVQSCDFDGGFRYVNRTWCQTLGYTREQSQGLTMLDIVNQSSRSEWLRAVECLLKGSTQEKLNLELMAADGHRVDISGVVVCCLWQAMPGELWAIFRDTTEHQWIEQKLRLLEKAVENTHTGISITDLDGRIIYTNPAEALMHGHTREELIGRDIGIFAPTEMRRKMKLEEIRQITNLSRESINCRDDGTCFPVFLRSVRIIPVKVMRESSSLPTRICRHSSPRRNSGRISTTAFGPTRFTFHPCGSGVTISPC